MTQSQAIMMALFILVLFVTIGWPILSQALGKKAEESGYLTAKGRRALTGTMGPVFP